MEISLVQLSAALLNGAVLALILVLIAAFLGRYRDAVLFGLLLTAAFLYVVFAMRADAGRDWVLIELAGVAAYGAIGWLGVVGSPGWLAAAWALHPIWDVALHYFGTGRTFAPPLSYPIPCLSFDLVVATYIACYAAREAASATSALPAAGRDDA